MIQRVFWHGHYVSYRRKVKNDGNNHKARDSVERIFLDGFQHTPPPGGQIQIAADPARSTELGLYFDKRQLGSDNY
jgi:hypothetical protein